MRSRSSARSTSRRSCGQGRSRKLKLDDLAAALVEKLGLPEAARVKVRRYYQELELGQLDPTGVAASVWVALAGLLGRDARGLAGAPPTSDQRACDVPRVQLRR